ncbi:MAG: bacterial proteasome activator family protein [Ilumatobacteraceae bacterium]
MTDQTNDTADVIEHGELVTAPPAVRSDGATPSDENMETITAPAKVMRIGSMVKQLLEEVKGAELDEQSRDRLAEIYERSIAELSVALSPDLQHELHMLTLPFKDGVTPTSSEIRVAHAQLVGWLEGLFHGIQATLFAQQLAARQQLEQMRGIPAGTGQGGDPRLLAQQGPHGLQPDQANSANDRPGTYL